MEAEDWRQNVIGARKLLTRLELLPDADFDRELQSGVASLTWPETQELFLEVKERIPKDRLPQTDQERRLERVMSVIAARELAIRPPEMNFEPQDIAAVEECAPVDARVDLISAEVASGRATPAHALALEEAVDAYRAAIAAAELSRAGEIAIRRLLASTLEALGGARANLGDHDAAETAFEDAARQFESADDELSAATCRTKLFESVQARYPDADQRLRMLLTDAVGQRPVTLGGAQTLIAIAALRIDHSDRYGAREALGPATGALAQLGYPVPGEDTQASLIGWIDAVPRERTSDPNEFHRTLAMVLALHTQLARVRASAAPDKAAEARSEMLMQLFGAIVLEMPQHVDAVIARLEKRLGRASSSQIRYDHERLRDRIEIMNEYGALLDLRGSADENAFAGLLERARRNVERARAYPQTAELSMSLYTLGALLDAAGRTSDAVAPMREAADVVSAMSGIGERDAAITALTGLSRVHVNLDEFELASDAAGQAIAAIERYRYRVNAPFLQGAFLAPYTHLYAFAIFSAWKLSDYDTMLARIELAKARGSVWRLLTRRQGARRSPEVAAHDAELRRLGGDIQRAAAAGSDGLADLRERRQREWDLREIGSRNVDTEPPAITVSTIQAVVNEDEAVLYHYWLNQTQLMVVTLTSSAIAVELHVVEPEQRELVERLVAEVRKLSGSNLGLDEAFIAPLADVVLPVERRDLLDGKRRLAISPHGPLRLLPFAAVPWSGQPLVRTFALRYIPNLASLLLESPPHREPRMLAIAVSRFPGRESRLGPLPLDEAEAIAAGYAERGVPVELRTEVTRDAISRMIEDGTMAAATSLLVSTHGESGDPEAPMDAILALADSAVDGLEIITWPLEGCEVVTLSACYGGQFAIHGRDGRELPGDELFGIPAAFLQAGAMTVLAPTWPVDARIGAPIVIGFHRRLAAGSPPDVALQQSQCEYLDDPASWPEAYFWAGLTLVSLGMHTVGQV